jgi:uncharacterized protein
MTGRPSPWLIGMIHLLPLPGSPRGGLVERGGSAERSGRSDRSERGLSVVIDRALADAHALTEAGFLSAMIENYGDTPFLADALGPETVAAMTAVASQVRRETNLQIGINALRNDARAALSIAMAVDAEFIRVNVHTGVMATDQGMIEGRAGDTLRFRERLGSRIKILADVHVKHATPISPTDITQAAEEAAYRGWADGLIVSGVGTGKSADMNDIIAVKKAVPDRPVLVGSGVTADNVASILRECDGVIVGSTLKNDNDPELPVDRQRAKEFIQSATKS